MVIGHEAAGTVAKCGSKVKNLKPGKWNTAIKCNPFNLSLVPMKLNQPAKVKSFRRLYYIGM